MSRVLLLRHARAGWASPGSRDFDRTLTESGREDIRAISDAMRRQNLLPDTVLCSPARRAEETLEELADMLEDHPLRIERDERLYHGDARDYLALIQQTPSEGTLLIVGHNPMLEDLALALAGDGAPSGLLALRRGLPTAGLAVLHFGGAFSEVEPGKGRLEMFLAPGPHLAG